MTVSSQQMMFFLQQLRKLKQPTKVLVQFYTAIKYILTSSISIWYAVATARDKEKLAAGSHLCRTCTPPGARIKADPFNLGQLSVPLLSGRRFWSIQTRTSCHKNSFFSLCHNPHKITTFDLLYLSLCCVKIHSCYVQLFFLPIIVAPITAKKLLLAKVTLTNNGKHFLKFFLKFHFEGFLLTIS